MKKIFYLFSGLATLFFASCWSNKPISKESPMNNKTYEVEYLFEHDGCKVYRFMDMGEYVYFTNCSGKVTSLKNDSTKVKIQNMVNAVE